jgi:hypothetical protein
MWHKLVYNEDGKLAANTLPVVGGLFWLCRKSGNCLSYHICRYEDNPGRQFVSLQGNRYWIDDNRNGVVGFIPIADPPPFPLDSCTPF